MKSVNVQTILLVLGIFSLIVLSNCKKKKEDPDPMSIIPAHNFINQNLRGKVGGKDWVFETGNKVILQGSTANMFTINLTDTTVTTADSCDYYGYSDYELKLSINGGLEQKIYPLSPTQNSAQFIYPGSPVIQGTGAVEILTIDNVKKVITGRIDVKANDNNSVNGNFKVGICQ